MYAAFKNKQINFLLLIIQNYNERKKHQITWFFGEKYESGMRGLPWPIKCLIRLKREQIKHD